VTPLSVGIFTTVDALLALAFVLDRAPVRARHAAV
jgi:hypothetical protein